MRHWKLLTNIHWDICYGFVTAEFHISYFIFHILYFIFSLETPSPEFYSWCLFKIEFYGMYVYLKYLKQNKIHPTNLTLFTRKMGKGDNFLIWKSIKLQENRKHEFSSVFACDVRFGLISPNIKVFTQNVSKEWIKFCNLILSCNGNQPSIRKYFLQTCVLFCWITCIFRLIWFLQA